MTRIRFAGHITAVLSFAILSSVAAAQVATISGFTSTPIPGVGHDYTGMFNETVEPRKSR